MYNNLPHAVTQFWESQKDHPSYADHPVHKVDKSKAIPLLMHGDEVAVVGLGKIWSRGEGTHASTDWGSQVNE